MYTDQNLFGYFPVWFDKNNILTWVMDDNSRIITFKQLLGRISLSPGYAQVVSAVFQIDEVDVKELVASVVSLAIFNLNPDYLPSSFLLESQDMFEKVPLEVDVEYISSFEKHIHTNPNVSLVFFAGQYEVLQSVYDKYDYTKMYVCPETKNVVEGNTNRILTYPSVTMDFTHSKRGRQFEDLSDKRPNKKNGQVKLFVSLVTFLTEFAVDSKSCVYIGCSPGINIYPVAVANPQIKFYLNDVVPVWYQGLRQLANIVFFSSIEDLANISHPSALFLDIYADDNGSDALDDQIMYASVVNADYVSFKRVMDWSEQSFSYVEGSSLRYQVFMQPNCSELREFVRGNTFKLVSAPIMDVERMLMHYDEKVRGSHYGLVSPLSFCDCWDCSVLNVAYQRLLSFTSVTLLSSVREGLLQCFDSSLKVQLNNQRSEYLFHFLPDPDILGLDIVDGRKRFLPTKEYGFLRITDRGGGDELYSPPYTYYERGVLMMWANGVLRRQDIGVRFFRIRCPAHSQVGSFPPLCLIHHWMEYGGYIQFTCGCSREYSFMGKIAYVSSNYQDSLLSYEFE